MSFASLAFFLFLPLVFAVHWLAGSKRWQNGVLLAASYVFYAWWDYRFCALMLASSLIDYYGAALIAASTSAQGKKVILAGALALNLLILGFFKYFNFFVDSLVIALAGFGLNAPASTLTIILPAGISFYTFQTMSYTIDVYRGQLSPHRNPLEYLTFVSFFPQLVAGPIERAGHLLPQFTQSRRFSHELGVIGCRLILWGLAKKMVLADNLGVFVDETYASPSTATAPQLTLATIFFAFQIYYDFSAYSDIAAGAANLFGIQLMRNFAYPYFSQSPGEFWRRWHISLSTWFRDYVYIPLGGRAPRFGRTVRNLLVTFLASGLWHGANWTFVVWGLFHGLLIVFSHAWLKLHPTKSEAARAQDGLASLLRILGVFSLVCASWVLFRASSLSESMFIYWKVGTNLLDPQFYSGAFQLASDRAGLILLLSLGLAIEWRGRDRWNPLPLPRSALGRWLVYTLVFWTIFYLGTQRSAEFIYFQF